MGESIKYLNTNREFIKWCSINTVTGRIRKKHFKQGNFYLEIGIVTVNNEQYVSASIYEYVPDKEIFRKIQPNNKFAKKKFEVKINMYAFNYNIKPYHIIMEE